jgi:hypothetical protein
MKKITLALLTAVTLAGDVFGQANLLITAPPYNSTTQVRLPSGYPTHKSVRSCFLIKPSEMSAVTGSIVNAIGFSRLSGTGPVASTGGFTLYIENTPDVTYLKSTTYATAIAGMTQAYIGTWTTPNNATPATMYFQCTPAFTYAPGSGVYIAYAFEETTPAVNTNTAAGLYASNLLTGGGLDVIATETVSGGSATLPMVSSDYRPCVTFSVVNTATNEVVVDDLIAPGKVSKLAAAHTVSAVVRNASIGQLSSFTVGLGVTGANTFIDVATVNNLAAGASKTVTFLPFTPSNTGLNSLTVVTGPDDNSSNNGLVWSQSVTCSEVSLSPPVSQTVFTNGSLGGATSYIWSFKYTPTSNVDVTGVQAVIPSFANAANSGTQVFPVVMDNSGTIISNGTNITIGSNDMDVYKTFSFGNGNEVPLTAGQDYYIGLGMVGSGFYPVGYYDPGYQVYGFYRTPSAGGTAPTYVDYGYLALAALVTNSTLAVTSSATRSFVCTGTYKETNTLTVTGPTGATYVWGSPVPTASNSLSSVVVTPTIPANSTTLNINYNVYGIVDGCKTNTSIVTVKVSKCTGIADNSSISGISIYPNPAVNGMCTVSGLNSDCNITVFNTLGQAVKEIKATGEEALIDLSGQAAGSYIIKITNSSHESRIVKMVNQ